MSIFLNQRKITEYWMQSERKMREYWMQSLLRRINVFLYFICNTTTQRSMHVCTWNKEYSEE